MIETIKRLKKERNAIILAHNYQPPEILEIADLKGDSLELSIKASETDKDVIVFCGVMFMAETASILSPEKTVLLPKKDAGCPMADMVTARGLEKTKKTLPNVPVVTYVNSSAEVKALSDICCTSANVIKIVESIDSDEILMVPDRNLAAYAASKTDKTIHIWDGFCPIHDRLTSDMVFIQKKAHPGADFIAHPECRQEVLHLADAILSTSGMLAYPSKSDKKEFIIGTENGLLYQLNKMYLDRKFYSASSDMMCPDMKKITYEDIIESLTNMSGEIKVPEKTRKPALNAVRRMLEV